MSIVAASSADTVIFGPILVLAILAIGVLVIGFWIWMLVDCIKNEPDQGNEKVIWVIVIALLGWLGALIYLFARRPTRKSQFGK